MSQELLARAPAWAHHSSLPATPPAVAPNWARFEAWSKVGEPSSRGSGGSGSGADGGLSEAVWPTVVDALGRPIAATARSRPQSVEADDHARGGSSSGRPSSWSPGGGADSPSSGGGVSRGAGSFGDAAGSSAAVSEEQAAWAAAAARLEETECLALARDSSPSSPAEPSAMLACRPALARLAQRLLAASSSALQPSTPPDLDRDTSATSGGGGDSLDPSPFELGGSGRPASLAASSSTERADFMSASHPASSAELRRVAASPPVTVAALRNEAARCGVGPLGSPPVLLWRAKRVGGSSVAALLVRYAFVHKLDVAGPQVPPIEPCSSTIAAAVCVCVRLFSCCPRVLTHTLVGPLFRAAWRRKRASSRRGGATPNTRARTRRSATGRSCAGPTRRATRGAGCNTSLGGGPSKRSRRRKQQRRFIGSGPFNLFTVKFDL
jgi:hypothetical protein